MKITKLLSLLAVLVFLCSALQAAPSAQSEEAVNKALKMADKSLTSAIPLLENAEKNYPFHPANMEVLYQLAMAYVDVIHSLSGVRLFVTPWTAACQAPLSSTVSQSLLKFMAVELVVLSHQIGRASCRERVSVGV